MRGIPSGSCSARWHRGLALTRVPLAPLSLEAVAELAEPYGLDGELYRVTAGNPFFVTEVCASGNGGIPATVRDSVLRGLHG